MADFWAYMLRCSDGSYYVGHTDNIDVRMGAHHAGEASQWTRARRPVRLIWSEQFMSRDDAFCVERQIKGWRREKKEALARRDFDALPELSRSKAAHPSTSSG